MQAKIFSDGSSRGNPGPGGFGVIVICGDKVFELGDRDSETTNNRMEMLGVIRGIQKAKEQGFREALVHTDSSYVLNGASKWMFAWAKNGWQTKTKEPVLNQDLWEVMFDVTDEVTVNWKLIKGHSGVPANERCDEIATSFADNTPVELFEGEVGNYPVDTETITPQTVKKSSSKAKAYSYISKVDGKIMVHHSWAECEARVKGKSDVRFKKSLHKLDEAEIIKEFSR